jgi:hypothetical protein
VQLLKKFGFIAVMLRVLIAGDDLPEKWELDRPLTLINDVNSVDNKWPEDHFFNAQRSTAGAIGFTSSFMQR